MTVELSLHVVIGLSTLAILSPVILVILFIIMTAHNRHIAQLLDHHAMDRRGWDARDRVAWETIGQLSGKIDALCAAISVRRRRQ